MALRNRPKGIYSQKAIFCQKRENYQQFFSLFCLTSAFRYALSNYLGHSFVILVISCSYLDEKAIQRQILRDYDLHVRPSIGNDPLKVFHELKLQRIVKYVSHISYLFCFKDTSQGQFLKNGDSKSIVYVIKHANFQHHRVHTDGVISKT